jgi:hypothetical protein
MWFGFQKADAKQSAKGKGPKAAMGTNDPGPTPEPPTPAQQQMAADEQMKAGLAAAENAQTIAQHQQAAKWHHTLAAYTQYVNPKMAQAHEDAAMMHHQHVLAKQKLNKEAGVHQPDAEKAYRDQLQATSGESRLRSMAVNKQFPYQNGMWGKASAA